MAQMCGKPDASAIEYCSEAFVLYNEHGTVVLLTHTACTITVSEMNTFHTNIGGILNKGYTFLGREWRNGSYKCNKAAKHSGENNRFSSTGSVVDFNM